MSASWGHALNTYHGLTAGVFGIQGPYIGGTLVFFRGFEMEKIEYPRYKFDVFPVSFTCYGVLPVSYVSVLYG